MAGTFVIRQPVSRAHLRAEVERRLPFNAEIVICQGRDVVRLVSHDCFPGHRERPDIVRFVSVLSRSPRSAPRLPMKLPSGGTWLLKVLARDGRFVFGLYRRQMKVIRYLDMLDRLFGIPATTRNWNTIVAIAAVLEGGATAADLGCDRTMTEDHMDEKSLFTGFWTHESKTTRNVLARIPDGSDYRPDPKSRTAQEIAWQIVCEERMIIEALESGQAEWAPPPMPAAMKDVLEAYETQSAQMEQRWKVLPTERWDGALQFFGSERPAAPMAWSFLFDIVHHRAQITTYLRPMGSTVPQIYGPSADEP